MKLFWKSLLLLPALAATPFLAAQSAQDQLFTASVDHIALHDVGATRIQLDVFTHVSASRKTKIKQVRFEEMHFGDLPVYLSPVNEHIELEPGKDLSLPAIPLTIYYRDLSSLTPIEDAVQDGQLTVSGEVHVDLDLNLLERALTLDWKPRAAMPVSMSVPFVVPGGSAGRTAAVAALKAADLGLSVGSSAMNILNPQTGNDELRSHYLPSMVIAETNYTLHLRDDKDVKFSVIGLGYRRSADEFVLTDETLEPWQYDVGIASAIQDGEATLLPDHDIQVWPAQHVDGPGRSLAQGQIVVVSQPGRSPLTFVPGANKRFHVSDRNTDSNMAVLRFTSPDDRGVPVPVASEDTLRSNGWDRLSLFRLREKGGLEVISTPASRDNNRITLQDSVDDLAFGSLLIAPDGAVGMVQDESSAIVLHDRR
jgi:hypothetical protein